MLSEALDRIEQVRGVEAGAWIRQRLLKFGGRFAAGY